jgi:hypothetical protein
LVGPQKMNSVANFFEIFRKLDMSILALSLLLPLTGVAQSIPRVNAESLDGKSISLPQDFAGKVAILIIGFQPWRRQPVRPLRAQISQRTRRGGG